MLTAVIQPLPFLPPLTIYTGFSLPGFTDNHHDLHHQVQASFHEGKERERERVRECVCWCVVVFCCFLLFFVVFCCFLLFFVVKVFRVNFGLGILDRLHGLFCVVLGVGCWVLCACCVCCVCVVCVLCACFVRCMCCMLRIVVLYYQTMQRNLGKLCSRI